MAATGAIGEATAAAAKNAASTRGKLNVLPASALMAKDDVEATWPRLAVNVLARGAKAELLKHCSAKQSAHSEVFILTRVMRERCAATELEAIHHS
jgi:hypothetical protein